MGELRETTAPLLATRVYCAFNAMIGKSKMADGAENCFGKRSFFIETTGARIVNACRHGIGHVGDSVRAVRRYI